jgi:GNAT superfamily N-acetyltransferase
MSEVTVETLTGAELGAALSAVARLRIAVFREWPYLYDGTLAYEQDYLDFLARADGAVIVAARAGDTIVGVATGSPLAAHAQSFGQPFRAAGMALEPVYYLAESVLLSDWRGRGLGHAFFEAREAHARRLGGFTHAAFASVVRPADHPLRPAGYRPLDPFWRGRGYAPVAGLLAHFDWKDIDAEEETRKPMQFWMKAL